MTIDLPKVNWRRLLDALIGSAFFIGMFWLAEHFFHLRVNWDFNYGWVTGWIINAVFRRRHDL